jgi:hypothetical protein
MLKLVSFSIVGLLVAAPAAAQITFPAQGTAAPSTAAPPAQNASSGKGTLVCEYAEDTGSRVSRKKLCYTPEEWQRIKAESRESLEKYQQQAKGPSSG